MTKTISSDVVTVVRNTTIAFLFGMFCMLGFSLSAHAATSADVEAVEVDALELQADVVEQILNDMSGGAVLGASDDRSSYNNYKQSLKEKRKLERKNRHASSTHATSSREYKWKDRHGSSTRATSTRDHDWRDRYGSSTRATSTRDCGWMGRHGTSTNATSTCGWGRGASTEVRIMVLEERIKNLTERIQDLTQKKTEAEAELAKLKAGQTSSVNRGKNMMLKFTNPMNWREWENGGVHSGYGSSDRTHN